ncbi:hypothetical protein NG895_12540 [Aeoliella sp. ICT_H6.2]|uniref:Uncharacterized protein n=1 Tax=Aeoliella straminimaris TaxID=2954799 RepID=A0A9X2FAS5_9BACT|nr:hypothetical protein [Aeoliella straminimaris]MCO6044737.1 hypothetical protein [Aeoliella straminimaris]
MPLREQTQRTKVIVFGIAFFYPLAGVTFQFLHYLLGLRELGFDPYYVEDSTRRVYDPWLNDMADDATNNIRHVGKVFDDFGFEGRWAYRSHYGDKQCYGLHHQQLDQLYKESDAFLNVTGAQELREEHLQIPCRVYVESDPFAAQVRVAQEDNYWLKLLGAHTHHFSFGENLGHPDCPVPIEQFDWKPTRQPVSLALWNDCPTVGGQQYTTIATWSNKNNDVEWNGETYYWTKQFAFEKIMQLPQHRTDQTFHVAVKASPSVKETLTTHGWQVSDSLAISSDLKTYKEFIQSSRGEFTVARDQYVRGRTGWQSDRSVCYLAAGRPVITEDTSFDKFVPSGEGLFAFSSMDDVLAALDTIESDYPRHCQAARDLAAEYLDAPKVVGSLMSRVGLL